ncbi:hypothetical protein [Treponema sp. OMZ 906]|uniref:hypothetical protein n=1 Tax=Treponema sp. OMZ 906 TaxID=2563662 RepID=UPI0020A37D66|nr:hypothetical protein [Treponema sp. OMZ 906]UTC55372.1 hypothetical protein E4N69_11650 [Treponema sp. OMZ 906]
MKSKKSSLTAALFAALIGTAFVVTACWQGAPAGGSGIPGGGGLGSGGGNTASSIEGRWKANGGRLVLQLKNGKVTYTGTVGVEVSDSGTYTITGNTITFTGFTNPGVKMLFNREFKYKIEGNILTLLDGATDAPMYQFEKA